MKLHLRQEQAQDHPVVHQIIETAFKTEVYSDHKEQFLVDRLRQSNAFIPELSIVAQMNQQLVGHIILTRIIIKKDNKEVPSLALAPVSVHPDFQKQGIGGQLIEEAHRVAKALGHGSVILLGHAAYYPRFGYQPLDKFGIRLPFEAPAENCMAVELIPGALDGVSGEVVYDKAFFE